MLDAIFWIFSELINAIFELILVNIVDLIERVKVTITIIRATISLLYYTVQFILGILIETLAKQRYRDDFFELKDI